MYYYKKIFDILPGYIFIHDNDGNIKKMNAPAATLFKNYDNIYKIIKDERIINKIFNFSSNLTLKAGETTLILPNNEKIVVDITTKLFETGFKKHLKLTIFKDITNIKEVEKQFCLAQKQEAIGAMAAGFAHDFKNILNNIKIYLKLIKQSKSLDQIYDYANIIEDMIRDSNDFIKHILSITRDTSSNYEEVVISELLREDIEIMERVLPKNISIELVDMAKNAVVRIIKSRFTHAIFNLCLNSVEAIGTKPGNIMISIERAILDSKPFVRISVTDNGCGIPQKIIDKIFDNFFTTKSNGSGLGLSMVKLAITDFGGHIKVESEEGHWTTFKIFLPEVIYGESE
ncbi:MAG: HAMP domain-containing histidine kinase [Calditerrivibrio sp.]|nr:HAMP domain-containing histidine kinase [Calditerrivibrio sp.]